MRGGVILVRGTGFPTIPAKNGQFWPKAHKKWAGGGGKGPMTRQAGSCGQTKGTGLVPGRLFDYSLKKRASRQNPTWKVIHRICRRMLQGTFVNYCPSKKNHLQSGFSGTLQVSKLPIHRRQMARTRAEAHLGRGLLCSMTRCA